MTNMRTVPHSTGRHACEPATVAGVAGKLADISFTNPPRATEGVRSNAGNAVTNAGEATGGNFISNGRTCDASDIAVAATGKSGSGEGGKSGVGKCGDGNRGEGKGEGSNRGSKRVAFAEVFVDTEDDVVFAPKSVFEDISAPFFSNGPQQDESTWREPPETVRDQGGAGPCLPPDARRCGGSSKFH